MPSGAAARTIQRIGKDSARFKLTHYPPQTELDVRRGAGGGHPAEQPIDGATAESAKWPEIEPVHHGDAGAARGVQRAGRHDLIGIIAVGDGKRQAVAGLHVVAHRDEVSRNAEGAPTTQPIVRLAGDPVSGAHCMGSR